MEIEKGIYQNIKKGVLADRGIAHIFDREEIVFILEEIGFKNINVDEMKYSDMGNSIHMYMICADKI